MFRPFLFSISIFCASSLPALAQDDRLYPRIEAGGKLGTERSLGTGEYWVPLSQGHDRVLYGDVRFMADDADNNEGNLGLGYRQIVDAPVAGQAVAGAHVWADRRRGESGNVFYQTAAGVELLGRDWDARANAYLPLSGDKTRSVSAANGQSSDPYLAGSGIYYDTGGQTVTTLTEEPQPGFDLELGARVPVFTDHLDAVRVYGGGYHFIGDKTEDVSGWRARVAADITPAFSIGARFQKDAVRGSQGFLEATLRFPFEAKRSFREEGLRARLDESPERDIDIVTGAKVTRREMPPQERVAVLASATGDAQRVLHVDNTAGAGGDGSKDRPFNTLKAAEAAMQAHDVIYVHAGDGTTAGQDEGIVIDEAGVSLIGSGTNFIYDGAKFMAASGKDYSGTLLAAATTAPVITNTEASVDNYTGNGVLVTEGDALLSGFTVDGATLSGISARAENKLWDSLRIENVISVKNKFYGIIVDSNIDGKIDIIEVINNYTEGNLTRPGIAIHASNSGEIGTAIIHYNKSIGNKTAVGRGIQIQSANLNSHIDTVILSDNLVYDNVSSGMRISSISTGIIDNISIYNNKSNSNPVGIEILADTTSSLFNVYLSKNSFSGNVRGVYLNDDTSNSFNVDLGGGGIGSTGENTFYGNTIADLRLDLDGGSVSAQGNWWGQAGGPLAGQVVSEAACPNCGTADTSGALDADPNL